MPVSLRVFLAGLCALAALVLAVGLIAAQEPVLWADEGVEVCGADGSQQAPEVVADGTGGAIVVWHDERSGSGDIYAQRVNALGRTLWATDGVTVCEADDYQDDPIAVPDGDGGAIVFWRDNRTQAYDIYAQRVLSDGTMAWATDGISVCVVEGEKTYVDAASDRKGGALVTWQDFRTENYYRVYAQRLDGDGNRLWYTDGLTICADSGHDCEYPVIAPDGRGGAYVAWQDTRTGDSNVYVQFVWADGSFDYRWHEDGEKVALRSASRTDPEITFDGDDNALVAWRQGESESDVYIQRMSWGSYPRTWGDWEGVSVCVASGIQHDVWVASDGEGGALVTWRDQRNGGDNDIYAQRMFVYTGDPVWYTNGVSLCTASESQDEPRIVSDGDGGAIAVWMDPRDGWSSSDIYAQKVNRAGTVLWEQDGIAVYDTSSSQGMPEMAFDGVMGAVVAWMDRRGVDEDIYAQRVGLDDANLPLVMKNHQ